MLLCSELRYERIFLIFKWNATDKKKKKTFTEIIIWVIHPVHTYNLQHINKKHGDIKTNLQWNAIQENKRDIQKEPCAPTE